MILTHISQDAEDRSVAMAIHQAILPSVRLESLPKSVVDVFITVLEVDGMEGCVAAGSIAASAALVDAGIEVLGIVGSTSAVRVLVHCSSLPTHLDCRLSLAMRSGSTQQKRNHHSPQAVWFYRRCQL